MDAINWKNTLLSWANKSGFIEKPFATIEHINLNEFYESFKEKMLNQVEVTGNVVKFLKDFYIEFEPNFDETGQLTSADYMYVYSLFLHFSCVRYPEPWFQQISCNLNLKCQDSVKDFLATLVKEEKFDRHSIRQAIRSATPATPRRSFLHLSTPIGTPVKHGTPQTPNSHLLDARLNEAKSLRAQLEAEKYEKGFLEVQNRQYEERLNKLIVEQRQHLTQINELKNELLGKEKENYSPNHSMKQKNLQTRFAKQINEQNEEILELKSQLEDLRESNSTLTEKLKYSEKLNRAYLNQLQDSEDTVLFYQEEIEQKNEKIELLQAEKDELQLHITQLRDSVPREILDSSSDLLENSRLNCFEEPESLEVVIDMKLKEVERENREIREKIIQYNITFSSQISELFELHDKGEVLSDKVTLEEHIDALVEFSDTLAKEKSAMEKEFVAVKSALKEKEAQLDEVTEARQGIEKNLEWTLNDLETLKSDYQDSVAKNEDFTLKCSRYKEEMELLRANLASLSTEKDTISTQLTEANENCVKLQHKLTESTTKYEILHVKSEEIQSQLDDSQKLYKIIEEDYQKLSGTHEKLKTKSANLVRDGQKMAERHAQTKKTVDALTNENQELKAAVRMTDECVKNLQAKVQITEELEAHLSTELAAVQRDTAIQIQELTETKSSLERVSEEKQALITELTEMVENLKTQHENKVQNLRSSFEEDISSIKSFHEVELNKIKIAEELEAHLRTELEALQRDTAIQIQELTESKSSLESVSVEKQAMITELTEMVENVKTQLEEVKTLHENEVQNLKSSFEENLSGLRTFQEAELNKIQIVEEREAHLRTELAALQRDTAIQIQELTESKSSLESVYVEKQAMITELTKMVENLKTQLEVVKTQHENEVQNLKSSFEENLSGLRTFQEAELNKIQIVEEREAHLKIELAALQRDTAIQIQELTETKSSLERISAEKQALITELTEMVKNIRTQHENDVQNLKSSLEYNLSGLQSFHAAELNKISTAFADLTEKFENLQKNFKLQTKELQAQAQDFYCVIADKELEISELKLTHASALSEISVTHSETLKSLKTKHKVEIDGKSLEIQELIAASTETSKQIEEMKISHKKELKILEDPHSEKLMSEMNGHADELTKTLTSIQEKFTQSQEDDRRELEDRKNAEIAELQANLSAIKDSLRATENQIASLQSVTEEKMSELSEILEQKEREMTDLKSLHAAERESLNKEINEKTSEIENLKTHHDQEVAKSKSKFQTILEEKLKGLAETLDANNAKKFAELQDTHQAAVDQMVVEHSNQLKSTQLELTDQINEVNEQHADILRQIEQQKQALHTQLVEYERQIEDHKHNIETLGTYTEQVKEESQRHHKEQAEMHRAEIDVLQRTHSDEIQLIQQQVSDVRKQMEKLMAENMQMEKQLEELKEERGTLIESLEKVSTDTMMMSEESEAVNSANKKLVETIEQLKAEKGELEQQLVDAVQTAKVEVQSVKDDVQVQLVTARLQLVEEMKPVQSVLEKKVHDFEGQLVEQKRLNNELIAANDSLTKELATMKQLDPKLLKLEENIEREIKKSEALVDRLRTTQENLERKESKIQILKDRIDHMQSEITKHEGENNLLQQQHKKLETQLAAAKTAAETLKQQHEATSTELKNSDVQTKINQNELEMRVASLSTENETLVLIADKLKEDNQTLQEELGKSEHHIENLEMETQKMKHQLNDATNTITNLNNEGAVMHELMMELERKYDDAHARLEEHSKESNAKIAELTQHLNKLKLTEAQLSELRDKYLEEHKHTKAQQRDIQILQAKLLRHREKSEQDEQEHEKQIRDLQKIIENAEESSDQKVKEVRAQLEDKLAQMKQTMRQMYKDEITKRDTKFQEILGDYNKIKENGTLMAKQLHKLNEEKLDSIKENQLLKYRLQQYEMVGGGSQRDLVRRQSAIPSTVNQRNFKAEEEEGELFSHTYLTDLKEGRMQSSENNLYGRKTLQLEEIQKRNSMMLPHMRSVYFTDTINCKATEDDIRAGTINPFDSSENDDSGSSLLHSRNDGKEGKKIAGKLAYHKPGPPTPSKNAGRLSVGKDDLQPMPSKDEQQYKKKNAPFWSSSKVKDETTASPRRSIGFGLFSRKK